MSVNRVNGAFSTSTYAAVVKFFFSILELVALTVAITLSFNFKIESTLCKISYFSATVFFFSAFVVFFSPLVTSAVIFDLMSSNRTFLFRGAPLIVPKRTQPLPAQHSRHVTISVVDA